MKRVVFFLFLITSSIYCSDYPMVCLETEEGRETARWLAAQRDTEFQFRGNYLQNLIIYEQWLDKWKQLQTFNDEDVEATD